MNYRQWKKQYKKQHGHNPPGRQETELFLLRLNTMVDSFTAMRYTAINRMVNAMTQSSYTAMQAAQQLNKSFAAIQKLEQGK